MLTVCERNLWVFRTREDRCSEMRKEQFYQTNLINYVTLKKRFCEYCQFEFEVHFYLLLDVSLVKFRISAVC